MDYFVYKREYKKEEWQPCSYDHNCSDANIFIFTCPDCGERIWGAWEYPFVDVWNEGEKSYSSHKVNDCFTRGFKTMLSKIKDDISKGYGRKEPSSIDYPIYRRIEDYGKEAKKFIELDRCPLCNAKLTKNNLHYHGHFLMGIYWEVTHKKENEFHTISDALSWYRRDLPSSSKNRGDKKHKQFLKQCSRESPAIVSDRTKKCLINNTDQLMDFLRHLITTERNIYSVSGRLKELYRLEYEYEVCAKESAHDLLSEKKRTETAAYEAWKAKQTENPESGVSVPKYAGTYPREPVAPKKPKAPTSPHPPVLATPGFFNKKRVKAENAVLTEKYEKACLQYKAESAQYEIAYAQYKEKLNIYNSDLAIYKQKIAQIQAEQEKKRVELVEKAKLAHTIKCEELRKNYFEAQREYEQIYRSPSSVSTPQVVALNCLHEEIKQAEEVLLNLYQGKQKIYDTGVIFEKYHDFVAIASFYEYLSSGRCTTLEGPHGAYNLYESEIRMNAIVSQLADVIKSLKQIQKNQFVIYTAINEATNELAALNKATQKMNITLNAMHGELATISRNTAVTAFYAKKNAELMDTLCFLTALN